MTYVSICGDDFMTYGVFIVARLLPKPPGFGLNRLACNHINIVTSPNGVPEAAQRLVHKLVNSLFQPINSLFNRVNDSRGDGAFVFNARVTRYKPAVLPALNMLNTSIKKQSTLS